jgi:hypothetical protein
MENDVGLNILCFKVPNQKSRQRVQRNISLSNTRGTYGSKSCNCSCSCTDGY